MTDFDDDAHDVRPARCDVCAVLLVPANEGRGLCGECQQGFTEACPNCGDGSGWTLWDTCTPDGRAIQVWVACADCNDDAAKPKPTSTSPWPSLRNPNR